MDISQLSHSNWKNLSGSGSPQTPEEKLSLCAEICIQHQRFDAESTIDHAAGIMINRHLWQGRSIKKFTAIGRDDLGEDETPMGAHISLAAQACGEDGLGGELYEEKCENSAVNDCSLSAHQREWDYLERHVTAAYEAYPRHAQSWPGEALSDWQRVEALARYAMQWKMRSAKVYCSFHPVDVLFHSSYCTGAATILQSMAMVAGFQTRFICISNHSMVEIFVNGRWVWADNIWGNGGVTPATYNYADMTSDPQARVNLTNDQKEVFSLHSARYRAPYHYSGSLYWHFASGGAGGRGIRNDVTDGFGVSVAYDPSCAVALYPEMKEHAFFTPKGWEPTVVISEKGSLIQSAFQLHAESALRKVFYIGACDDNPITGGIVKFRLTENTNSADCVCTLDGKEISCKGIGQRYQKPTIDFILPVELLTEGEHELVISMKKNSASLVLYPDIVEPYFPPHYGSDLTVDDDTFTVDHYISPDDLNSMQEPP